MREVMSDGEKDQCRKRHSQETHHAHGDDPAS
jgi:hypothetical protein